MSDRVPGTAGPGLAALLMLADARLPAGGHAHSGGVEAAVAAGRIRDVAGLTVFLRGRLRTVGAVAAGAAALACRRASGSQRELALLDREVDARTPSPAQRAASRQQGKALLRAARAAWPSTVLDGVVGAHHPVVLGVAAHAAGAAPAGAACVAAYLSVSGPATAAIRLLGFDPIAVNAVLAGLGEEIAVVADHGAVAHALPACTAPRLDLLAEAHARSEVRLFAS